MNSHILLQAAKEVLTQGEAMLHALDDGAYSIKHPAAFDSSVGEHYRHCLDHFGCLFSGLAGLRVDYDDRKRDPRLEVDRSFALARTSDFQRMLGNLDNSALDRPVSVSCKVSYAGEAHPASVPSTVAREVMFCISHAIHHYALIRVMLGMLEMELPEGFGVAPSTIKYHLDSTLAAG